MKGCSNPFIKNNEGQLTALPCGKCPFCIKKRISGWSFRLMQEEKKSVCAHFVTLTYNNDEMNVNNGTITKNGYMTVNKRHPQLFMKKLRKINDLKLKYYLVSEYGSDTMRPHYHAIIFNAGELTYNKAWTNEKGDSRGNVYVGQVTGASIGYVLKYINKKGLVGRHENDDRVREFQLMSKGLGKCYVNEKTINWHKNDIFERLYLNGEEGKKLSMPRYYKERIYNKEERGDLKAHFTGKYMEEIEELISKTDEQELREMVKNWKKSVEQEYRKLKLKTKQNEKI